MVKFALSILTLLILPSSLLAQTQGVDASLGGAIGYSINTLRYLGNDYVLENYATGLGLKVGMNEVTDEFDNVLKGASWGFEFTVDRISDKDINVTKVTPKAWTKWKKATLLVGVPWGRILPGENGGSEIIPKETRCVGGSLGIRFKAKGLPWEFGGSWLFRYDGSDDANISDLHLVLVPSF